MDRIAVLQSHLCGAPSVPLSSSLQFQPTGSGSSFFVDRDDDVVICSALRTPITKANRGGFKDTHSDELLSAVFSAVIRQAGIRPSMIDDICVGNVLEAGGGARTGRIAQFFSDIPETVPLRAVNRFCASGLEACMSIAASIRAGDIDIGLAGGVESMSTNKLGLPDGLKINPRVADNKKAMDTLIPMGITSENVAERFSVSRAEQDQMAARSHAKATQATETGRFAAEIVPVKTKVTDKLGKEQEIVVSKDDGIRSGTTIEGLAKLKPVFKAGGSTTAGNSSQLSDGAAAVLLARRSAAQKHRLPVIGTVRGYSVVGVAPDVMGIGPAFAIPEVLHKLGLMVADVDVFEVNEAFASQAAYTARRVGIPPEKLNPNGGAIALGHPVGCTGARMVATILHELKRRNQRGLGVVSMCMGSGMGAAAVLEYSP